MQWCEAEVVQGRGKIGLGVFLLVMCGYVSACSHALYHQVRPGETLSGIAQRYGVPYQDIARFNTIRNPDKLEVGQWLRIPHPKQTQAAAPATSKNRSFARAMPEKRDVPRPLLPDRGRPDGDSLFTWPVEGEVTSGFGPRNGSFHDGIDIAAPRGVPVLAAADGQVIFSDVLRGYGNVVIVRHANGYLTVYAHNQVNHVKEGQPVLRGERLAEVGQSGRATGASLHFEVRKDNLARDPLHYLPQDRRTVLKDRSP
ncbi:MAG: M23 family metallopeptidase [Deltaproteobacteria bacterium]|nr:M23 family metallopeptidase [Deltaproteobacteria bacterium]